MAGTWAMNEDMAEGPDGADEPRLELSRRWAPLGCAGIAGF